MENFASYECNYWMTGVDADANNYQLGNTKDSWSMPGLRRVEHRAGQPVVG